MPWQRVIALIAWTPSPWRQSCAGLQPDTPMNKVLTRIIHERRLCLIFNFAYEVVGQGLVSDATYEYGIQNMRDLRAENPEEWATCDFFNDYFVVNDDWEYTGSGVPRTNEVKALYLAFLTQQERINPVAKETPAEEIQRLQGMNSRQMATITKQAEVATAAAKELKDLKAKVDELMIWERFASYLFNHCIGEVISEDALDGWVNHMQETKP